MNVRKRVAILGSTGSIGTQALDVIARNADRFEVVALAAGKNTRLLAEQAKQHRPRLISCATASGESELNLLLAAQRRAGFDVEVARGESGLRTAAADRGAQIVLAATDGAVAFDAVFAAVDRGIDIALANKELIVAAGELLVAAARLSGARLLPVDSEHSALFQCLVGEPIERVARVILTASGGPFWETPAAQLENARIEDALRHPTWSMGTKNTVDSASMMNKGLEVIEASRLFGLAAEQIDVLVHRTSFAHGFVVFRDGNVKAQLAAPDMRLPIGYALAYPDRLADTPSVDPLAALGAAPGATRTSLAFERPDDARFPCLRIAYEALERGGTIPAALSAANEVAVAAFVTGEMTFGGISRLVRSVIRDMPDVHLTIDAVRRADRDARVRARAFIESKDADRGGLLA